MIVFLETGPLGGVTNPALKSNDVLLMQDWALNLESAGHTLIVPAIAVYEQRREHLLRGAYRSIFALDTFINKVPGRYLAVTDGALKRASDLWADVRKAGLPTADRRDLDCDILIAAQVLDLDLPGGDFVVATSNVRHMARLVNCQVWQNIHA